MMELTEGYVHSTKKHDCVCLWPKYFQVLKTYGISEMMTTETKVSTQIARHRSGGWATGQWWQPPAPVGHQWPTRGS